MTRTVKKKSFLCSFLYCSSVNCRVGVTVYFHAILSKDFKLNPDTDKVCVMSGGFSGSGKWEKVCEMSCVR